MTTIVIKRGENKKYSADANTASSTIQRTRNETSDPGVMQDLAAVGMLFKNL